MTQLSRRSFLQTTGSALFAGSLAATQLPRPTPAQIAWQDYEVGMLFSLDLPVFASGGWKETRETYDPNLFNPAQLDTDQWLEAAREAGCGYAVFTATHFNGFLQWQSDLYPYGLKQTSWRDGKGDVMQDFVASCHKYGIAPGVFLSCHRNAYQKVWKYRVNWGEGGPEQAQFARIGEKMTEELCSRYGPLCEIWYDAGLIDPNDGGPDVVPIVNRFQKSTVFYSSPRRRDHRWIGNESGYAGDPCWATMPDLATSYRAHNSSAIPALNKLNAHGDPEGNFWAPAMVDVPIRNHEWFWRPDDEHKLDSVDTLVKMYYTSVGLNCTFIIGAVPDQRGLVPEADRKVGAAFGQEIQRRFGKPVAETTGHGNRVVLRLPQPSRIDHVVIMEDIAQGERVRQFVVEAQVPGPQWQKLFAGESIGHKRIIQFPPLEAAQVRVQVLKSTAPARFRRVAAYATT
jgi:alpha-L-fucosidase